MLIHLYSPIIYIFFVKIIGVFLAPCPRSNLMKYLRTIHNIFLSWLSLIMLIGITYANYITFKFNSLNNLLCLTYNNNSIALMITDLFLYSKYIEWGDTLFLHLSGKPITMLHYTHHMTTVFLLYVNLIEYISPHMFIFMSLNCLVHIWMYWYFAFPRGVLYPIRKLITQSQIIQHVICLITIVFTMFLDNCKQNKYGNEFGLFIYSMYLFYFSIFYLQSYQKENILLLSKLC